LVEAAAGGDGETEAIRVPRWMVSREVIGSARPRWMANGVSGVSVVKNVVEDGRKELAQILHPHMEELIVKKVMDLETKIIATLKNAPSMVSGVSGVSVVKHVVEERRQELAQIQPLHMEELIVKKNMDDLDDGRWTMKTIATLTNALSMVSGVLGQNVLNHVVEDGRSEVAQIHHLDMVELNVQLKVMDLQIKQVATLKNAPSMVSGVSGVSVVKHVVED